MKAQSFILALGILSLKTTLVLAEDEEVTTSSKPSKDDTKMIVIEEGSRRNVEKGRGMCREVTVESGTSEIIGGDEDGRKGARRSWDQECKDWKIEMRSLNKNNLLLAECGRPTIKESFSQSEKSYRYESTAKYKIRVTAEKR